jgi:hypothetical protein
MVGLLFLLACVNENPLAELGRDHHLVLLNVTHDLVRFLLPALLRDRFDVLQLEHSKNSQTTGKELQNLGKPSGLPACHATTHRSDRCNTPRHGIIVRTTKLIPCLSQSCPFQHWTFNSTSVLSVFIKRDRCACAVGIPGRRKKRR